MLNGSLRSTERKYMRRSKGKCDIFFGKRHRLRKEEMKEHGDLQRTQQESPMKRASSEDRKHTSGGVFIAVDGDLVTVVGERAGAVASIPGSESRITQAWVNVRGGMRVFSVYFWHSEGWTPRNEALLVAV